MKFFWSLFSLIWAIAFGIAFFHWIYQITWAWERLWQGFLVFMLLSMATIPYSRLEQFFSNGSTVKGKYYKDHSLIYKFSWFLCLISGYIAVSFLMLVYWIDTTDGPYEFGYWAAATIMYSFLILPLFRAGKELQAQNADWEEKKAKIKKEQKEAARKAKAERQKKQKEEEARIKEEKYLLSLGMTKEEYKKKQEEELAEIKRKQEEKEAREKAKQEKLQKEINAKKTEASEVLESLKTMHLKNIKKLNGKKEDLELLISKEKNIIKELGKKYSFLEKIVPDRID